MTNTRVDEIDLLRFLAALSVVIFHYIFLGFNNSDISVMPYPSLVPIAKYCYLGLDLFFMISGFGILMTASNGSVKGFVISRIVRLYPAFWACCTITFVMTIAIGGPRFTANISQYLVNMTLLSGFVGVPPIDGSYWSMFVEMKFYALIAIVLLIGKIHQAQLFLIFWMVASIALVILPLHTLNSLLIVNFSAYFIAGATYFLIWSQGISLTRVGIIILTWGLALYQSTNTLSFIKKYDHTDLNIYVVAIIITIFFLVMLLVSLRRTGWFSRKSWLTASALTYPLYLIHQNVGYMIFNIASPTINPDLLLWSTIIIVLGTAYALNIYVEKRVAAPMKNALTRYTTKIQRLATRSGSDG